MSSLARRMAAEFGIDLHWMGSTAQKENSLDNPTSTKTDLFTRFQQRLSAVGGEMHFRGGIDAGKRYVRMLHLAQLIAERL